MDNAALNTFMQKIVAITPEGMGGAGAGIVGGQDTTTELVNNLRNYAQALAVTYTQKGSSHPFTQERALQVKGALVSLNIMSAISDEVLNQLNRELDTLVPVTENPSVPLPTIPGDATPNTNTPPPPETPSDTLQVQH